MIAKFTAPSHSNKVFKKHCTDERFSLRKYNCQAK